MLSAIVRWMRTFYSVVFYLAITIGAAVLVTASVMSCFGTANLVCELSCHLIAIYGFTAAALLLLIGLDSVLCKRLLLLAKVDIACLLIVLLHCSYKVIPLWIRSDKPPATTDLTLLHLNLHAAKNSRYQSFFALVDEHKPDLVLVSESSTEWSEELAKHLKQNYPFYDRTGFKSEFGFYSKYPITMHKLKHIEFVQRKRLFTQVQHPVLGTVTVLLVHPVTPIFNFAARNEELSLYPKELKEYNTPQILVGDMNCTSWSPYFERMQKAGDLKDCQSGFGFAPTWPGVMVKPFLTIDHLLVSQDLTVQERRLLPYVGSDHLPLLVKLGRAEHLPLK